MAAGILQSPAFAGLYLGGISTSAGEELNLESSGVTSCEAAGMTPEILKQAVLARFQYWQQAVNDATLLGQSLRASVGWPEAGFEDMSS